MLLTVREPLAVAVTGGMGCGKSEAARMLHMQGIIVCDADDVARDVVRPGTEALKKLVARFGKEIVRNSGELDRGRLSSMVFADAQALADLNAIVHPPIRAAMRTWASEQRVSGRNCAGIIPLLYEVGAEEEWDFVMCIAASPDVCLARLRARGWSDEEISRRNAAQWSLDEKIKRADVVIWNNGSLDELAARVRAAWNELLEKESRHGRRR